MKTEKIIHLGGRLHRSYEEISYLQAEINYTHIHFKSGERQMVATTLGIIEKRLPKTLFYRVNRSTVVNLSLISFQHKLDKVILQKRQFPISRRRKEGLIQCINQ